MLVLHGAAQAADAKRIERALERYRQMAASVAPGAELRVACDGPFALIFTEAGSADPSLFAAAMKDLETAERLAVAHSTLLNGLSSEIDVLPARLAGALADQAALFAETKARAKTLLTGLERIAGAAEYALRLTEKAAAPEAAPSAAERRAHPAQHGATGRAYLQQRLQRRQSKAARIQAMDQFLDAVQGAAQSIARDVRILRGPTERRPNLVIDIAVLAARADEPKIEQAARAIETRAGAIGLDFAAIGPWAPFSFAEDPEAAENAAAEMVAAAAPGRPSGRERAS